MSIKRGRKNGVYPTYTIVDHGTGQHPQDFAKTFLSLSEKVQPHAVLLIGSSLVVAGHEPADRGAVTRSVEQMRQRFRDPVSSLSANAFVTKLPGVSDSAFSSALITLSVGCRLHDSSKPRNVRSIPARLATSSCVISHRRRAWRSTTANALISASLRARDIP